MYKTTELETVFVESALHEFLPIQNPYGIAKTFFKRQALKLSILFLITFITYRKYLAYIVFGSFFSYIRVQ